MENNHPSEECSSVDSTHNKCSQLTSRPTSLNLLLNDKLSCIPAFPTQLYQIQPIFRSEVQRLLETFKISPQNYTNFLDSKTITEDQENFVSVFTQKLNELNNPSSVSSTTCSEANINNTANLSDFDNRNISNFMEFCRQSSHPGTPASICLNNSCLDVNSKNNPSVQSVPTNSLIIRQEYTKDESADFVPNNEQLLISSVFNENDCEMRKINLGSSIQFGNITTSPASVLQMLGIESKLDKFIKNSPLERSVWPLQTLSNSLQDSICNDSLIAALSNSPLETNDNQQSSLENDFDHTEQAFLVRSSSVSSVSSSSLVNNSSKIASKDMRLDPNEQSRMRLERKRARNRDAARKCRERKIRLIKSLEKDVFNLNEENKLLRFRLSRSRCEVERLKSFVNNHIDKGCPSLSEKVA